MNTKKNKVSIDLNQKAQEENEKKRYVLMLLSALTIIIAIIGASFSYYTANVNKDRNESITIGTTTLEDVTFQSNKTIKLLNAYPGTSDETVFTITNPNKTAKVRYTLKFVADTNDFSAVDGPGQLLITFSEGKLTEKRVLDFTDSANVKEGVVVSNVELEPMQSDNYNVHVEFVELGKAQDANTARTFAGHIEVTHSIAVQ